jgi:hypothetical protein
MKTTLKILILAITITATMNSFSQTNNSDSTNVKWFKEIIKENLNNFMKEQKKESLKYYKFETFFLYISSVNFKDKTCKFLIGYKLNEWGLDDLEHTNYYYFKRKIVVIIGGKYCSFLENELNMPKINDHIVAKAKKHMGNLTSTFFNGGEDFLTIECTKEVGIKKEHVIGYFQLEKEYMFDPKIQSVKDFHREIKNSGLRLDSVLYKNDSNPSKREDYNLNQNGEGL